MTTIEYIEKKLPLCVRENKEDDGDTLIGLPYPYTVPSIEERFQEMYYWDTYFVNHALIIRGNVQQAINNVENMFYLIDRFGFVLNGNRTFYKKNSQPPFLSEMVKDIYEATKDKVWLKKATEFLIKEYSFWENERQTEIGLNQYRGVHKQAIITQMYTGFLRRIRKRPENYTDDELSIQYIIACESGWDISPRFGFSAHNFVQIDLNSLLCGMERNIAYFLDELELDGSEEWVKKSNKRLELMNKFMLCDGVFYDYNFKENKTSGILSCASLYPMWLGLLTKDQAEATVKKIARLEAPYGIYATEKTNSEYVFQWEEPNGWAPLHQIAIEGLLKYGYTDKAKELAEKYVSLIDKTFEETGEIWEKYNVEKGNTQVVQEGVKTMASMLGWTSGVYIYAKNLLDGLK